MRALFASLALLVLAMGSSALPESVPAACQRQIFDAAHLEGVPVARATEQLAKAKSTEQAAVEDLRHYQLRVQNRFNQCKKEDKEDLDELAKRLVAEYKTAQNLENEYKTLEAVQDEDAKAVRAIFEKHAIAEIEYHKRLVAAEARVDACYEAHRTVAAPAVRKAEARAAEARAAAGAAADALRIAETSKRCESRLQGMLSEAEAEATEVSAALVALVRSVCPQAVQEFAPPGETVPPADVQGFCGSAVPSFRLTLTGGRKDARSRAVAQFCGSIVRPVTFTSRLDRPVADMENDFCDAVPASTGSAAVEPAETGAAAPTPSATGVFLPPVEVPSATGSVAGPTEEAPPAATASATGSATSDKEAAPSKQPADGDRAHLQHALDDGSYASGPTVTFKGPEFSSSQRVHPQRPLRECVDKCRSDGRTGPDCYRACMAPRRGPGEPAAPLPRKPAAPVESAEEATSDLAKCWQRCHESGDDKPACYHGCIHSHA